MTFWRVPHVIAAALSCLLGPVALAQVETQWNFDGDLSAAFGAAVLDYESQQTQGLVSFGDAATLAALTPGGGNPGVMALGNFNRSTHAFVCHHDAPANGGGTFVNDYTLIWDLFIPAASYGNNKWVSLYNTNCCNDNDGDLFVDLSDNSFGIGDFGYGGQVLPDTWYRLAVTFETQGGDVDQHAYIDGVQVASGTTTTDGRFSIYSVDDPTYQTFHLMADDNGQMEACVLASAYFADWAWSPAELAALGGVSAGGATTPWTGDVDAGTTPDAATAPDSSSAPDVSTTPDTSSAPDTATAPDRSSAPDTATAPDSSSAPDAAIAADASPGPDAVLPPDAGSGPDVFSASDSAGAPDAGSAQDTSSAADVASAGDAASADDVATAADSSLAVDGGHAPDTTIAPPLIVARGGPDRSVMVPAEVVLDGTASEAPDDATFTWTRVSAPGSTTPEQVGDEPMVAVRVEAAGNWAFQLTITARGASDSDMIVIEATEQAGVSPEGCGCAVARGPAASSSALGPLLALPLALLLLRRRRLPLRP